MRTQSLLAVCGITVAVLAAGACGGSGASSIAPPTPSPTAQTATPTAAPTPLSPAPPPAGFPTGSYTGTLVSQNDAPGTLTLNGDGTYRIAGGPVFDTRGVYAVSGNQISFQETAGECHQIGTYTWQISGTTLKLTVVNDTCAHGGRGKDFAEHPWTKQP